MAQSGNEQSVLGAWPGFLVAFLLTIGAVWVQTPFRTERPPEVEAGLTAVGAQDVDARLWQDPFAAVDEARKPGADPSHDLPWLAAQIGKRPALTASGGIEILAILVNGGPSLGAAESRRRYRYAALSGLMLEGLLPDDAEHVGYFVPDQAPPDYIPFEWFSPFGGDKTQAGKPRHLLLLWIDQAGLRQHPKSPVPPVDSPMPRIVLPGIVTASLATDPGGGTDVQDPSLVQKKAAAASQEWPDGPHLLARMSALFSRILSVSGADPKKVRFSVIGPTDSTGLTDIRAESASGTGADPKCGVVSEAQMWSPFATIPEERIEYPKQGGANDAGVCTCGEARLCVAVLPPGFRHRSIANDSALVNLLVEELGRRHIGPDSRIALVGQWDTAYSRALADAFTDAWHRAHDVPKGRGERRIFRPSYMRGLDGVIPGGKQGSSDKDSGGDPAKAVERAEGDAQLDYLRRMRDSLVAKDAVLRASCTLRQRFSQDCGIRAIGVLGNDYFDKLLVLKALKPVFRNAVFFTTDLDADMFNPRDNQVTRNLIVASGYGLTLRGRLQREVPPLRDNYQTSLLLAVRLALGLNADEHLAIPPPARLFEVGRTGPVELVDPHQIEADAEGFQRPADHCCPGVPSSRDAHPNDELNAHYRLFVKDLGWVLPIALCVVLIAGGLLAVLTLGPAYVGRTLLRWWRGLTSGWLPPVVVAFSLGMIIQLSFMAWQDITGGGEPLSWVQGVSVWPAELLRLIAGLTALAFLVAGHDRLCGARRRIEHDFGLGSPTPPKETAGALSQPQAERAESEQSTAPAPMMSGEDTKAPSEVAEQEPPSSTSPAVPKDPDVPMESQCGELLDLPAEARATDPKPRSAAEIWRCYMRGCRVLPRWLGGKAPEARGECAGGWGSYPVLARVTLEVFLFFVLAMSLMVVLGFPNRPVRSDASWWIDLAVILLVLIPFLGLLFYMVDATRQTLTLARDLAGHVLWSEENLRRVGLVRWSRATAGESVKGGDVDWLDVHLIARVSRPVGDLVWYPVLVLVILAFGRHSVFDAWDFPPALMIVILIALLYVVGCAWTLRSAAERVRKTAIRDLSLARLRAQGRQGKDACIGQLDSLLKAVSDEREGAFRPFSQQPVVQALLTLASSVSGLALIQYSSLLNL